MATKGFRPSTAGERLFAYVAEQALGGPCLSELAETRALRLGGRTADLSQYFFGFACASIFTRLMRKAERVLESERSAPAKVVVQYVERSLEMGLGSERETAARMAALAIDAVHTSHRSIPPSVAQAVGGRRQRLHCYLCGSLVRKDAADPGELLEYEHIWPSSYGGDSVEENLLPACSICNKAKDDMVLWHTAHISGFCLKPQPSPDEMTRVGRKHKIASYMRTVFDHAVAGKVSLKDAAIKLGPIDMANQQSIDPDDARDFFNLSFV